MSNQINTAYVQQFTGGVLHLAQQKKAKLLHTVMHDTINGKYKAYDRLGLSEVTQVTSQRTPTPLSNTPHSRRRIIAEDFIWADTVDKVDLIRVLTDPTSQYAQVGSMAMARKMDKIIINALVGNAASIDSADSSSNVAIAHTVDEDFITANSDITLEKVIEARRIMLTNELDMDSGTFFVLDAIAYMKFIQENEVASSDFNVGHALSKGGYNTFMGFEFIQSELLTKNADSFVNCIAYTKSSLQFAVGQPIQTEVDKRPDLSNLMQIVVTGSFGAVRMQEEGVVVVEAYRA